MNTEEIEELTDLLFVNGYDTLKTINELNNKNKEKDKEIEELNNIINDRENEIEELKCEIDDLKGEIDDLKSLEVIKDIDEFKWQLKLDDLWSEELNDFIDHYLTYHNN